MSLIIEARALTKIYSPGTDAEVKALDGVDLRIERGAYMAIVGESGSGKTTLMHILGALDRPSSGSVALSGRDLGSSSRAALARIRAREIGFVFQGLNLIASLDATQNVEAAARYAGRDRAAGRRAAEHLLIAVGLSERMRHLPAQLSGGQQQRVAIARALVNEPALLLADEPTGELDTKTADGVLKLLERFNRELGQTIVMVTHNPAVWSRCDSVVQLRDGRVVDVSTRSESLSR